METTKHKSYKDLLCWQKANDLVATIYKVTINLRDHVLPDQLRRAGLSIMNNIAEGYSRKSSKEKSRFFEIAMSSCTEIESMSYLLEKLKLIEIDDVHFIREHSVEIHKMILGLDKYFATKAKEKGAK